MAGYVLVHVLEVLVPGHELGEISCEVSLGDSTAQCPVPSTLDGENIVLPIPTTDADPVIYVRARGEHGSVGLVVVPVNALVPMEIWNVWYAMDDGTEEFEEQPPEETPKMHLLLEHVPAEAAAQEPKQSRDMRTQDFLLRALQQLNASLEAKVLEQPGVGAGVPPAPAPSPIQGAPRARVRGSSGSAPAGTSERRPKSSSLKPLRAAGALGPVRSSRSPGGAGGSTSNGSHGSHATASVKIQEPAEEEKEDRQKTEEAFKLRLAPYERAIAALEEKQRLYDDQETRIKVLSKSLEEQQGRSQVVVQKLQEDLEHSRAEAEQERTSLREVASAKTHLQQRLGELEQEVALRKSHEESLQQRLALMEGEMELVHQKCQQAEAAEAEAKHVVGDVEALRLTRQRLQEQLQEQGKELSLLREENWQLKEDRGREIEKARATCEREILAKETLQLELLQVQDEARDKEAEAKLAKEKMEVQQRRVETLENEVSSLQALLERERQHRSELDHKLGELEMQKLSSTLDEHRTLVRGLRRDLDKARQELSDERGRSNTLETEMSAAKKELVRGLRQLEELKTQVVSQDELREEIRSLSERNEALREQTRTVQQESRKTAERVEREVLEHLTQQKAANEERESRLANLAELKRQLAVTKSQLEEQQLLQEQSLRALEARKAVSSEDLARQLQQQQEDLASCLRDRNELHEQVEQATTKFREEVFALDQRQSELESLLEDRNNEIKLLMYRLQELSSRYVPVKSDATDLILGRWINGYRPAVPFFRLSQGLYLFGRRQVICKISNDKPVFRVGGGFIGFEKFLEQFASEELERLLTYDLDDRTGEPKFLEGLKAKQIIEESGLVEELRQKEEVRNKGLSSTLSRRSLNSTSRGSL